MEETQKNNPLHGITLEHILRYLLMTYTWEELDQLIRINCFHSNPSLKSSLKFLRKTDWARKKVEKLFIDTLEFGKIVL
ncbi:MAG: VF530 family DNA-binding protein [Sphingobacteriaceae bacterium]